MRHYMINPHAPFWIHHLPPFPHSRWKGLIISPTDQFFSISGTLPPIHLVRKILPLVLGTDRFLFIQVFAEKSLKDFSEYHYLQPSPTLLNDFLLSYTVLLLCGIYHYVTFYCLSHYSVSLYMINIQEALSILFPAVYLTLRSTQ